ncbi:hypothetical protein B0H13DRAFT_2314586 [Mycena leptocephala]|nr:hypothetical protein B0H13DRAFT_2314586 [Mycena leptocephala]
MARLDGPSTDDGHGPVPLYDIDEILANHTPADEGSTRPRTPRTPVYDLDKIIARLTLEDEGVIPARARTPVTPPPAYSPNANPSSPVPATPSSPSLSPRRTTVRSPTVYSFTSPARTGFSQHWSEAAAATQGTSNSHVRAMSQPGTTNMAVKLAYVVFRGVEIGVFLTWNETAAVTSGVRFSLQQGYSTVEQAHAAFEFAHCMGWTCRSSSWAATPISPSQAPKPIADGAFSEDSLLCPRKRGEKWYVVYAGVNPGVFATSLECALNVLGIRSSVHESVASYAVARARFEHALNRGHVHVCLACTE